MHREALAALHGACFTTPRPWTEAEFGDLLHAPGVFLLTESRGFLLGRVTLDEAELLTLAVDPKARRQGTGRALVAGFAARAREAGAASAFLEVAADNAGARALYSGAGWQESGWRRNYYRDPDGGRIDALIMTLPLDPAKG